MEILNMKKLLATIALSLISASAFAHPGGHTLTCKSASKSGSKQNVQFLLSRANAVGLVAPFYSVTIDGKKTEFKPEDEMKSFGETYHNSPLGVITVTATNREDEKASALGNFSVVAIPNSVKAFDPRGKLVKWRFNNEKDACYDANGSAQFKGIFHGYLYIKGSSDQNQKPDLDTQIMDCELTYNSGMAC
jgi:hypothetical protein